MDESQELPSSDEVEEAAEKPVPEVAEKGPKPIRVWPAIVLLVLMWGLRIGTSFAEEMTFGVMMARMMAPAGISALLLLWWLFASRARISEKLLGIIALVGILFAANALAHKSVVGFGIMLWAVPWGMTAFAVGLVLMRNLFPTRTVVSLLAAALAFGYWDLVRTDEVFGDFETVRSWRWEPSPEDRLNERIAEQRASSQAQAEAGAGQALAESEWPSFRGPNRIGALPGVVLSEDWLNEQPREIWRIPVGPGWSSFSVAGNRLFTQEQRGEEEVVVCYDARDGKELWAHSDETRFWEVIGGAGPRATPTLHDGSLYALGASGLLNRLDPVSGEVVWTRDMREDADREPPTWGFSSSPLVTHGVVIVHAGGEDDKGILAYDLSNGDLKWGAPAGDHSYSSPQLSTVAGTECVLMVSNTGVTFVDPENGDLLGHHELLFGGYRVLQPLVIGGASVLMGTPMGEGTVRLEVTREGETLATEETWHSTRLKPYYNDFVAHKGFLYGFNSNIFACIDLSDGSLQWKGGRYGYGQVLLLPDSGHLLVASEKGDLVLLRADPNEWNEIAKHKVLEGKTWNHPVLIGNRVYVRNGAEAACFELPVKEQQEASGAVAESDPT